MSTETAYGPEMAYSLELQAYNRHLRCPQSMNALGIIPLRIRSTEPTKNERIISTCASCSFRYARDVLKGSFPLGEAAIAVSGTMSYEYAVEVLKAPFTLGESAISKVAQRSYMYARDVLKGPFPLGEAAIAISAYYAYCYAQDVLKAPFPLGEPVIATEKYTLDKYKQMFPLHKVVTEDTLGDFRQWLDPSN